MRDLLAEVNALRRALWLLHGHVGLYHKRGGFGDDGEMQCGHCAALYGFGDYKRGDVDLLIDAATKSLQKYVNSGGSF